MSITFSVIIILSKYFLLFFLLRLSQIVSIISHLIIKFVSQLSYSYKVIVHLRSQLILPIFQSIPERLQHLFEDVDGCEFFQESDNFECSVSVGLILCALVLLGDDAAD